ncbi:MAG: hypothetical protein JWO53_1321, partial [Chlamydiia bacterium]|nr:hypothetical protein [Chlamydiia bacterium]
FEYRVAFRDSIELTKEDLALFTFDGFRSVGAPHIETFLSGADGVTVQSISQQAVATSPGTFTSQPSIIEGLVYREDQTGKKIYIQPLLKAEAPSLKVEITPFPEKDKPVSFTGAIGSFAWNPRLLSPYSVAAGEKIQLEIVVVGQGDLTTVTLPDLSIQPGFQGNFRLSDLSPPGEIVENTKRFIIELRPTSNRIKEIPAMEFSSFNPAFGRYAISHTAPIPITVRKALESKRDVTEERAQIAPIEIESNLPLDDQKIEAPRLGAAFLIGLFIVLSALFGVQFYLRKWLQAQKQEKKETSRTLLLKALTLHSSPQTALPLIQKALLLRLYEIGETSMVIAHSEALSQLGIQGEVRKFLAFIEKRRFSPLSGDVEIKEILEEASSLYYLLKEPSSSMHSVKAILFLCVCLWGTSLSAAEMSSFPDQGLEQYKTAECTEKLDIRKKAFNEALSFYLHLEPKTPSGQLAYNIGNCYYQLSEYGLALLYYYRAERELPRNSKIAHNIFVALNKTGQETGSEEFFDASHRKFLSFVQLLIFSPYEKEMALFALMLFTFIFASLFLWLQVSLFRSLSILSGLFALFVGINFIWAVFFAPYEAVIIQPGILFVGPGKQYAVITKEPLIPGLKVKVEEVVENGTWLKIKLSSGEEGYITKEQSRII